MEGPPVVSRRTPCMKVLRRPRAISCEVNVAVLSCASRLRVSSERGAVLMNAFQIWQDQVA